MTEKITELRGNHLIPLYNRYKSYPDNKHGKGFSYKAFKYLNKISVEKYGEEFTMHSNNLYFHLFNHPEQKVRIINGDDIFCGRCPLRENKCENNPSYEAKIANGFGLEINKEYTMDDIIKKLENEGREFYEKNSALFTLNALISLSSTKSN